MAVEAPTCLVLVPRGQLVQFFDPALSEKVSRGHKEQVGPNPVFEYDPVAQRAKRKKQKY